MKKWRIEQALRYVHSFPVINAIIGIDNMDRLEENIEITRNFYRYNERQLHELEQLIAHFSRDGNWFK